MKDGFYLKLRGDKELKRRVRLAWDKIKKGLMAHVAATASRVESGTRRAIPKGGTGGIRRSLNRRLFRKKLTARVYVKGPYVAHVALGTKKQKEQAFLRNALEARRRRFFAGAKSVINSAIGSSTI